MRTAFGAAVLAVLVTAVGCGDDTSGSSSGDQPSGDSGNGSPTPSLEHKLAVIDAEEQLDSDDPAIENYADALDQLEAKCNDRRGMLADYAVKATELLDKKGVEVSALEVMVRVDQSIPRVAPRMPCSDVFAAFVTLTGRS